MTTHEPLPAPTEDPPRVTVLTDQECWELLAERPYGRLAYALPGEVHIVPVNHVVRDGRLLFRTAEGSKLLGVTMLKVVAFEVDEVVDDVATSVVAHGAAVHLHGAEADRVMDLPHPVVPTDTYEVVAIDVTAISGRRFHLVRD